MDKQPQKPEDGRFYVTVSDEVQGPYDLDFIEAMVLSGIYPPDVPVCGEGSEEWNALGGVRPATLSAEPAKAAPAAIRLNPMPPKGKNARNVLIGAGVVAFIVILSAVINSSSTGGGTQSATPTSAPPSVSEQASQARGGTAAEAAAADAWMKANGFSHGGSNGPTAADLGGYTPPPLSVSTAGIISGLPRSQDDFASATPSPSYLKFDGKTYRVSDSDNAALQVRQDEMQAKAKVLADSKSEAKDLGDEIERERTFLDRTDQDAVDRFNRKVDRYNALGEQADRQLGEYNTMVDSYNSELVRVGTPVQ